MKKKCIYIYYSKIELTHTNRLSLVSISRSVHNYCSKMYSSSYFCNLVAFSLPYYSLYFKFCLGKIGKIHIPCKTSYWKNYWMDYLLLFRKILNKMLVPVAYHSQSKQQLQDWKCFVLCIVSSLPFSTNKVHRASPSAPLNLPASFVCRCYAGRIQTFLQNCHRDKGSIN